MDLLQSNNIFWNVLESDICVVPKYIKNILMFCNFGNVLSLQKFDNDDIIEIERMAKNQFKPWLDKNMDKINLVDYFGPIYHTKPEQFTFTCGDKKMIQQISEYVKSTVQRKGYGYFRGEKSQCLQHAIDDCEVSEEELEEKLFNGVLSLLEPYGNHLTSLFTKDMVVIRKENGQIKGSVRCVICDANTEKEKKKRRKTQYSQYWNGEKWILSNFANHHLNKIHPIAKPDERIDQSNSYSLLSLDIEPRHNESHVQHSNLSANGEGILNEEETNHSNLPITQTDDNKNQDLKADNLMTNNNVVDDSEDASIVELEENRLDDELSVQVDKLRAQFKVHNIRLINNVFQSKDEQSECEIQLSDGIFSKIEVCHIDPDGNCLFGATVHQRYFLKVNSDEYIRKVAELRMEVVDHIKNNFKQYERLLLGRVYARRGNDDTENKITEENLIEYLDDCLSKDKNWAGLEAIQAISEIYNANVVIFNEWGEVYCGNSFNSSYENFITLAFRVSKKHIERKNLPNTERDHYDSVIKISDEILNKCVSTLFVNHAKSCSFKKRSDIINIE